MKISLRKKVIAFTLCMVMVLSSGTSALADETVADASVTNKVENGQEVQSEETANIVETEAVEGEAVTEPVVTEPTVTEPIVTEPTITEPESTPESTPAEQPEAKEEAKEAVPVSYEKSYKDESAEIKVTAEAGVLPENTELSVTPIVKKDITDAMSDEEKSKVQTVNAQYDFTNTKLVEDGDKNQKVIKGFLAYDISFTVDGKEIEPNGDVKVVIQFKEAVIPEGVTKEAAVAVKHLKEEISDEIVVEDMSAKATVQTTDEAKVQKVEMSSDSFSTYALTWSNDVQSAEVYSVQNKTPTPVATIDSTSKGVSMKMIDYDNGDNQPFPGAIWQHTDKDQYGVKRGILSKTLAEDGYPTFVGTLWGTPSSGSLKKHYENAASANNLFLEKTYLEPGHYFYYNSGENAATYNSETQNFTVYKELMTPSDQTANYFRRGNFFPYDTFGKMTISSNRNLYDEAGYALTKDNPRYNEVLYLPDAGANNANYHFGMELSAKFFQTKDGVYEGNPIKYEFTGDDDLWLYVDGVLVLDMGGCHDARSGYINFSDGEVYVQGIGKTTIRELFKAAGKEDSVKWKGQTFADFTEHSFKMWYMERGRGASNLKVKFNMPVIPEESINVAKIVTDTEGNTVDYAEDIDFQFNIKVEGVNYKNKQYEIFSNGAPTGRIGETDENGNFTLKHLETAMFNGIPASSKYQVTETGAYMGGYEVTVEGVDLTVTDADGNGEIKVGSAATPELTVGEKPYVIFTNKVKNTATLSIQKVLKAGSQEALQNTEFPVTLKLNGKVYTGDYKLNDVPETVKDGVIKLKANDIVKISGLPYGVSFEVEEQTDGSYQPMYNIEGKAYDISLPEYNSDGILTNEVFAASGMIAGDCTVKVENEAIKMGTGLTNVTVTKTWKSPDSYSHLIPKSLEITLYEDVNRNGSYDEGIDVAAKNANGQLLNVMMSANEKGEWIHTWYNLPADTDYVVVETCPDGFKQLETTYENNLDDIKQIGEKNAANNNTKFSLGKNNIVLVKPTGNAPYFLWSAIDLHLSREEIKDIAKEIEALDVLTGDGNFNPNTMEYYGGTVYGDIQFTPNDTGWTLSFDKKSTWSLFWNFSYTRTQKIALTNEINPESTIQIDVNKLWGGDQESERPQTITIQLYKDANGKLTEVGQEVTVQNVDGKWTHKFENLKKYENINGKYQAIKYTVKEIKIGGETVDENGYAAGYHSNVSAIENGVVTITNIKEWQIIKVSKNSKDIKLGGAEFKLVRKGNEPLTIWGRSNTETGEVKWYKEQYFKEALKSLIPDGTYTLSEEKAPGGYAVSKEVWNIEIKNGVPTTITSSDRGPLGSTSIEGKKTYYFENEAVYSLPSSGGNGIYWYMIGGVLLMIAASLILYKRRYKEVQKN